jgi:hypothetical protein
MMNRLHIIQHEPRTAASAPIAQAAEQNIAVGAKHIEWQQELLTILERISISAEAIDGARALLTTFLETQAQREKDRDRIRASLDCNLDPSSTVPLAQPVDQPNEAAGVDGVAGAHPCADPMPEQGQDGIFASPDCNLDSSSTVPLAQPVDQPNEAAGVAGAHLRADRMPEQGQDGILASPDCNLDSSSTVPLAQSVDQPNEAAGVAGAQDRMTARPEAKPGPVQFEAKPVWRVGRAAVAWIACLLGRHRNRWNTGGPRR